jgi:hypothetical protein
MDGGVCVLIATEYETKSKSSGLHNNENHPEYIEYVKLLKEYFEIKNDNAKLEEKFREVTAKHQRLVGIGIIKL